LFQDPDFQRKASVDRFGRKVKPQNGKKELERLYRLEKPERKTKVERKVVGSDDESENEEDEEEVEEEMVKKKDPARDGGFSGSESEEESTSAEEESDEELELADETAGQEQTEDIPMGEVTKRIAVVNLDWDHIRAMDIMKVASSFLPTSGRVEDVVVYPSEFGRERLQREEIEGPPREIFASSKNVAASDDDSVASGEEDKSGDEDERIKKQLLQEQADEGNEFDTAKLREYQLERLRYYYAVISCDSKPTAKALYDAMDGREYLSTANFFDLRFIPDETSFDDDQPRDACNELPTGYKPNDFRTEALTHSKVRLTWDDDDTTRKEVQKRAFSRAELDENDLQAYIGSDSSDAESIASRKSAAEDRKANKKEAERMKMRAALGLADQPTKSKSAKDEPVGDMQITFTSGLANNAAKDGKAGVFENEPQDEESTRDRYIRKERDRKQKRKEKMKAGRSGTGVDEAGGEEENVQDAPESAEVDDAGFDDPFFTDPTAAASVEKKAKKAERLRKREEKNAKEDEANARRAELELLMAADKGDEVRHFDMREIEKAEKEAKRKGKKGKDKKSKSKQQTTVVDDVANQFKVETEDPRFKALFESHEYAIDPTNPKYKGTEGMKALLEEGRKKRKREDLEEVVEGVKGGKKVKGGAKGDEELNGLVARLKGRESKAK